MSSGDFAAELRQSVADSIALVHNAAKAAKSRIGQAIPNPGVAPIPPLSRDDERPSAPRPAVNFFAEEPVYEEVPAVEDDSFASALAGPPEPLPEGAISFDDDFSMQGVDDEGIPVWEDAP
jgi:hypothetical protein